MKELDTLSDKTVVLDTMVQPVKQPSPDTSGSFHDFCNGLWGVGDGSVDALFARMRGAARTTEELRNFWKERSAIEEDYANRLAKLAKMPIGKDETGELRNSIDTLRLETNKQAGFHAQLAQQIRTDLEVPAGAFASKQEYHKEVYQAAIEEEHKAKQTREQRARETREKYELDCVSINSYTTQSTLVQGNDLEKVQLNEDGYAQETKQEWEQSWKVFYDTCQDLEKERMVCMKDNMWAYANAVSTVCVSDDESCENIRLTLERLDPEKVLETFVRDHGTGNAIPEPRKLVNYPTGAPPASFTGVVTRASDFVRSTQRVNRAAAAPPTGTYVYDGLPALVPAPVKKKTLCDYLRRSTESSIPKRGVSSW